VFKKNTYIRKDTNSIPVKQITTNQIVSEEKILAKDRRPGKGRTIALSRRLYRLLNSDVYYVESENSDNLYYFVKFKPDVFEWCSCMDNSTRNVKCKHLWSIEFAIRMGTLKDINKLPEEAKRYYPTSTPTITLTITPTITPTTTVKSYEDDDYSF
jgi:hypothetical protein